MIAEILYFLQNAVGRVRMKITKDRHAGIMGERKDPLISFDDYKFKDDRWMIVMSMPE